MHKCSTFLLTLRLRSPTRNHQIMTIKVLIICVINELKDVIRFSDVKPLGKIDEDL